MNKGNPGIAKITRVTLHDCSPPPGVRGGHPALRFYKHYWIAMLLKEKGSLNATAPPNITVTGLQCWKLRWGSAVAFRLRCDSTSRVDPVVDVASLHDGLQPFLLHDEAPSA